VADLVLGAFERGRMRISRIVTYSIWVRPGSLLHMRLDTERSAFNLMVMVGDKRDRRWNLESGLGNFEQLLTRITLSSV
jgi:hypothetical protein